MRNSIRSKHFLILSSVVVGVVVLCWLLNVLAYESFYLSKKKETLVNAYHTIAENYTNATGDDIELILEKLNVNRNLNIIIYNDDQVVVYGPRGESFKSRTPGRMNQDQQSGQGRDEWMDPSSASGTTLSPSPEPSVLPSGSTAPNGALNGQNSDQTSGRQNLLQPPMVMRFAGPTTRTNKILVQNDSYTIATIHDNRLDAEYVELYATFENGYSVLINTPMASIRESVDINNRFLIIVGLIAILVGGFAVVFISGRISRPILQLSEIASDMAKLKFDKKYPVRTKDEIGLLGESINTLSDELEETISSLKTANLELQRDIERKTKIDDMRREFLSNVSHELKTPIALIQGYAEGLNENVVEDEENRRFYCNVILDESQKMDSMIKKIMALMQLESANAISVKQFDVVEVIKGVLEKNRVLLQTNGINPIFDQEEPVLVWGDEFLIEDVIRNYISNAINHAAGDKIIQVRVVKENGRARIGIYNTGENIPAQDLAHIWKSFYKVDKARSRQYGGNGIGLAVVAAIMKAHDKPYGVNNAVDGVEFYFELDM